MSQNRQALCGSLGRKMARDLRIARTSGGTIHRIINIPRINPRYSFDFGRNVRSGNKCPLEIAEVSRAGLKLCIGDDRDLVQPSMAMAHLVHVDANQEQ